jgi:chromosome partitioning protein
MRVIGIYNKKGGTGKTSLAEILATALAMLGYHCALIDGDEQANASILTRPHRYEGRPTLTRVVCDDVPLLKAMYQARRRLWIVPADMALNRAVERINANSEVFLLSERIEALQIALSPVPADRVFPWWDKPNIRLRDFTVETTTPDEFFTPPHYLDFILFDNPPNPNALTWSMLHASEELIIPVELEEYAFQGMMQMLDDVGRRARAQRRRIRLSGIVPFNVNHTRSMTLDYLASIWRAFPGEVTHSVHTDATIPTSQSNQETIYETNRASRAGKEIFALALQLVGYEGQLAGWSDCQNCATARRQAIDQVEEGV